MALCRQYSDDGEESAKDVLVTSSTDPYHMLLNEELEEALEKLRKAILEKTA